MLKHKRTSPQQQQIQQHQSPQPQLRRKQSSARLRRESCGRSERLAPRPSTVCRTRRGPPRPRLGRGGGDGNLDKGAVLTGLFQQALQDDSEVVQWRLGIDPQLLQLLAHLDRLLAL
ncbi:unnamed protein product, partial [Symbiodinium sp. KB8]